LGFKCRSGVQYFGKQPVHIINPTNTFTQGTEISQKSPSINLIHGKYNALDSEEERKSWTKVEAFKIDGQGIRVNIKNIFSIIF